MHFHGPVVRPKSEIGSLIIEVTAGCSHNACTFCNFYRDTPLMAAPLSQIEEDLQEAKAKLPEVKRIWAAGGDPFMLDWERQIAVWDLMKKYFPDAYISTYGTVNDVNRKTAEEIRQIREHGLSDLVIGVESGDDEVLNFVNKGYTSQDILEAGRKLDEAELTYRIIYLGGMAGRGKLVESARRSAGIINQIHPVSMTMTNVAIFPGTKLEDQRNSGEWLEPTELERMKEIRELIADLKNPITVDTATPSSSLYLTAALPEEREAALKRLDQLIGGFNDKLEEKLARRRENMDYI